MSGHDASFLARGAQLANFTAFASDSSMLLNTPERTFLDASRQAANEERCRQEQAREAELAQARELAETQRQRAEEQATASRRLRRRALWLAVALVGVIVAPVAAVVFGVQAQRNAAETARQLRVVDSQRLAGAAQALPENESATSMRLAIEAAGRDRNPITERVLRETFTRIQRRGTLLVGHTAAVMSPDFSPDRQRIVTVSEDQTARLWGANGKALATLAGHTLVTFQGHNGIVYRVAFSPDGQRLVTTSQDGTARLWDLAGNTLITYQEHTADVIGGAFNPDGRRIATASEDRTIQVWDLNGKTLRTLSGHENVVYDVSFSPDGARILSTSDNATARLWNLNDTSESALPASLTGHTGQVRAKFSADGQFILTTSSDGAARLWSVGESSAVTVEVMYSIVTRSLDEPPARLWNWDGQELAILRSDSGRIIEFAISDDGQRIVTGSDDRTGQLWDAAGNRLATLKGHESAVVNVTISPDNQRILTGDAGGKAILWDANGSIVKELTGHTGAISALAFSPADRGLNACEQTATH
jgi:WD40 repeat protein